MADSNDVDKRVRYFTNQLLTEQDMTAEQAYHLDRERRLIRAMYTPGIVSGLELALAETGKIVVKPGTAIDASGRQIVLASARTLILIPIGDGDPNPEHTDQLIPFDPITGLSPQPWLLAISYSEVEDPDSTTSGGSKGNNRWLEAPAFALLQEGSPQAGIDYLVLGRLSLSISDNGVSIDALVPDDQKKVRIYVGLNLRGPLSINNIIDADKINVGRSLRVTGASTFDGALTIGNAGSGSPLTINNAATVNSSLTVNNSLSVNGALSATGSTNLRGNLTVGSSTGPVSLTVIENSVQVGKVMGVDERIHASAPLEIGIPQVNTREGTTNIPLITLYRPGTSGDSWSNFAQFCLSRFSGSEADTSARTQLTLRLTNGADNDFQDSMNWKSDGTIAINDRLTVSGDLTANGIANLNGNVNVGTSPSPASLNISGILTTYGATNLYGTVSIQGTQPSAAPLEIRSNSFNRTSVQNSAPSQAVPILRLLRPGLQQGLYTSMSDIAEFSLSRFSNETPDAHTQLDIGLTNGAGPTTTNIMSLRSDGTVSFSTPPIVYDEFELVPSLLSLKLNYKSADYALAVVAGFRILNDNIAFGITFKQLYMSIGNDKFWYINAVPQANNTLSVAVRVMFVRVGWVQKIGASL